MSLASACTCLRGTQFNIVIPKEKPGCWSLRVAEDPFSTLEDSWDNSFMLRYAVWLCFVTWVTDNGLLAGRPAGSDVIKEGLGPDTCL